LNFVSFGMSEKIYPIKYKDKLGRLIYTLENEFERVVFMYYQDSDRIKVKYHYMNNDVYIDAFSKSGDLIFSTYSRNIFESKIEKKHDGTLDFIINPHKLKIINSIR